MFIVSKLFRLIFNCPIVIINPQMDKNEKWTQMSTNYKSLNWDLLDLLDDVRRGDRGKGKGES